jgi:hypothetical protein
MSKKIFYTDTSVPPTRLVESGSVGDTGGLPEIAALDPLMAASNFEPDPNPEFLPTEEEVQNRVNQLNAELDQSLAAIDRRIQGFRTRLEASDGRDRQAARQIGLLTNQRESTRLVYQDRITNAREDLSPNNFAWLKNRGFNASTSNIQALAGSVEVLFGSVTEHRSRNQYPDTSFDAFSEKNLSYRRRFLGGADGYTKQSIVVQGLLPEYRSARIATLSNNRFVSNAEFQLYGTRVQREIGSFKKFVNILNRTVISDNAEKERLGLRAENRNLGNQYMNPYTCVFMPIAIQTDWVKDSKVTHDYLNKLNAVTGVTTIDAEFNYPAPVEYYNMSPEAFAKNGADGNYSALLDKQTEEGVRVREVDTIPESRKKQLPRYVQVSFTRRSFGRLSKKIEEVNGFSTFVPKLVDALDGETKRDYFFKSRFQFLDGDGRVVEADQSVPVQVVDMEAELNDFIASLTSQEEPTPLPPDYFGEKPVVKDEAGNDSPPQLDECVSFLDRIKMASLQSELRAVRREKAGNLNYENLFKYIQGLNDEGGPRERKVALNAGKPEILFYRIDQHEVDAESGAVDLEPRSKYYVRGGNTKYTYVDPRVEFGAKYKYVIYAYVIAPALHYDIGQVRPVVAGGDLKSPPISIRTMEGAFSTAQDPFSQGLDYLDNNDTFKQAYDAAKQNVVDFKAGDSLGANLIRTAGATLNEMNVAMNVYSRGRLLLAKVPVSSILYETEGKLGVSLPTTTILDRPPVPPHVDIVPFRNNSNQILINFNGQTDKIFPRDESDLAAGDEQGSSIRYIGIEPSDNNVFEAIRQAQLLENFDLPEGHLEFASEGEDLERFEVYRTTFEPDPRSPYEFFAGNKLRDVYRILGQSYTDNIRPNVNYYYTFRAVDKQGNFSNPTEIYKVYISEDKGQVVPTIKAFKPVRPRNQKDNKTMRKFLMIDPYFLQTTPAASQEKVGQLPEKTLGSKFKIRITSRDTGRKIDLNLRFEPAKVISRAELLDIAVRLKNDLLDLSPGLVEDRIAEINKQLQSANISAQDFGADLEAKLKELFGEGNYEPFLAQFQGRGREEES